MIIREKYLQRIKSMMDTEFIKVITGVRRSGKSYLLMMLRDLLLARKIPEAQICFINFENPEYFHLNTFDQLYLYLKEHYPTNKRTYFLFDEIQEVTQWQKLINGLRVAYDCDIYITGSNASLLSGELATYLTGRYVEIQMHPLSFQEYLTFKNEPQLQPAQLLNEYLRFGGFPSVVLQKDDALKKDVLNGIYNSILLRDVALRATVKEPELLSRIATYLLDNIGQLISTNKIANTLRSNGRKVSNNTVENYLQLLEDSFLFYKVTRFDIRGKEHLKNQGKYYTVDLGFILSQLHQIHSNRGSKIENLVFLELKKRGYQVYVGKYDSKEIDFVATKSEETVYIQVTEQLPANSQRETENLLHLPTGHKKMIITNSWMDVGTYEGIAIVHLQDFLLDEG